MSFFGVFSRYLELHTSEHRVPGVVGNIRVNITNLCSTNVSRLWLISCQFLKLVDRTNCHKLFLRVFSRYLKLLTSERRVPGVVGNVRGNPTNHCSTNVSRLRLIPCQFSKSVDRTDCRKSFLGVFCDILSYPCRNDMF